MRAGALRQRLEIQSATETPDSAGEPVPSWSTDQTVWASIEPVSGGEALTSERVFATATHRIRIRYTSGLTNKMRGKFGTRIFDFQSIRNLEERNREIEIMALERDV